MKEYQAAEYLGMKTKTLARRRYARTGPAFVIIHGDVHYNESAVREWSLTRRKPGRVTNSGERRVRLQVVIKPRLQSKLKSEAKRLGLSEGAYIEKLIEEN